MSQTFAQLINGKSATVEFSTGSASTPSVAFSSDTNTGIYSPGADQVAISTNGTRRFQVSSDGTINVFGANKTPSGGGNSVVYTTDTQAVDVGGSIAFGGYYIGTSSDTEWAQIAGRKENSTSGNYAGYLPFSTRANGGSTTERLRITSAGLVGVGTSSPSTLFHCAGIARIGANDANDAELQIGAGATGNRPAYIDLVGDTTYTDYGLRVIRNATGANANSLIAHRGTGDLQLNALEAGAIGLFTNDTQRLRITSAGNVGIGTTSAGGKLHVSSGSSSALVSADADELIVENSGNCGITLASPNSGTCSIRFADPQNNDSGSISYNHNDETLRFATFSTERARFDSSGRWLLGTSTAFSAGASAQYGKFQIVGNTFSASTQGIISIGRGQAAGASITSGAAIGTLVFSDNTGGEFAQIACEADAATGTNDYPGRLVFSTTADGASSPTEAMRITNARKVRIDGATVPAAAKLGVTASLTDDNGILIKNSVAQASGQNYMVFYNSSDNLAGSIQHTGATTVNYSTSSDYRLKENVTPVSDAVIRLQQLKPCRFNFKTEPEKTVDGFLAHQVQTVVPEAISGTKDEVDADGKPVYQGIDQSKLVPLLTAALQEALGEIESLKARVAALEAA